MHTSPCRPPSRWFPCREKATAMDRPAPRACAAKALRPGRARAIRDLLRKNRNIPAKKTSCAPRRVVRSGWWRFPRRAIATTNPRHAARAAAPRPMAAAESASTPQAVRICSRSPPSCTQPIEDGQRRFLCARCQIPCGTDARRASLLAPTRGDELARILHEQLMRAEKGLGKADAAGVRVEEVKVRFEELLCVRADRLFEPRCRKQLSCRIRRALANRGA